MTTSILSLATARPRSRTFGLLIAAVLICVVLLGFVFAGEARAAVSYTTQEIAFINQLNQYRAANGLQSLMLSDMISEACDRHAADMGKYAYFSHYSLQSDWFAYNATPWDRMAMSGYTFNTSKAENIAAGQATASDVFTAWKSSSGHNANMLGSAYKVIGVSQVIVPGSPYTSYWVTDFGGNVDQTAHAPGQPPAPPTTLSNVKKTTSGTTPGSTWGGTWASYTTASAYAGSYMRSSTSGAYVVIAFKGTRLDWIAMKGTSTGIADVYVDGSATKVATVDLRATSASYQLNVWTTGTLADGYHTVKIVRSASSATGKYVTIDAVDVAGTLVPTTRIEENSTAAQSLFLWNPAFASWNTGTTTSASGGTYKYINTAGAKVTINFTGPRIALIAKTAPSYGNITVTLDGAAKTVSLYSSPSTYKKMVYASGFLTPGNHTLVITRSGTKSSSSTGCTIDIDAIDLVGQLR